MNAPAIETTMPAHTAPELGPMSTRSTTMRYALGAACITVPTSMVITRPAQDSSDSGDLQARLVAANQRAAELEEQLAAALAGRDAAEHEVAQLEDRNRELASDLDDALDQLAGHALHAEQERLFRTPAWSPWSASAERGGFER